MQLPLRQEVEEGKERKSTCFCFVSLFSCFPTAPPNTLNFNGAHRKRKTLVAPEINISLDQSEGSLLSDDFLDTPDDLDINVDDIETPDETDSLEFLGNGNELEWEGELEACSRHLPGPSSDSVFLLASPASLLEPSLHTHRLRCGRGHRTAPGESTYFCDSILIILVNFLILWGETQLPSDS